WTSVEQLVNEFRFVRYDWALLDWPRIERTIRGSDRFEVRDGMIRAVYGHSVTLAKPPAIATPPAVLYHGTSAENVPSIFEHGLLGMRRRFVHLSSDYDWVVQFLDDKPAWTIFSIETVSALEVGVRFRKANRHVWLTASIAPPFLLLQADGHGTLASS